MQIKPSDVNYKFLKKHRRCTTERNIYASMVYLGDKHREPISDMIRELEKKGYPYYLEIKFVWFVPKEKKSEVER